MKITSCIQDVAIINRSIQRKSMEERREMLSDPSVQRMNLLENILDQK